jgi:glycosyltransferase domain-containing protein
VTPEEIELLSQLTVVIPTCERPENLERAIEYWRDTPVTVHIVDGSKTPWFPIGKLLDVPTVNYHHVPPENNEGIWGNYCRRMRYGAVLPTTKFSALCADDDAFTISGLCGIVETLNNDANLDAMIGRAALYRKTDKTLIWQLRYADLRNSKDYCSDKVSTRLLNQERAPWLYYGIIKTDLWRMLFQISFRYEILTTEKLMSFVDKALCRIQIIERIVWLRQGYVPRTNVPEEFKVEAPSVLKQLLGMQRFDVRRKMRSQIVTAIRISSPHVGKIQARRLVRKLTKPKIIVNNKKVVRWKRRMIRRLIGLFAFLPSDFRRKLTEALPWRVSGPLGYYKIMPETLLATAWNDLDGFVASMNNSGIDFCRAELKEFEKLMLKPREELRLRADI